MSKAIHTLLSMAAGVSVFMGAALAGPLEQKQGQGGSVVQGGAGNEHRAGHPYRAHRRQREHQARGQQQVDHDPGGQVPDPRLDRAGLS